LTTKQQIRGRPAVGAADEERFPPLSTTLEALLDKGSDRSLRQLIYKLSRLTGLMGSNRRHFAAYIGISEPQYLMVVVIADTSDATVSKLAAQLEVSSQFVTIEVAKLIKAGVVEKRANAADRRSSLLALTEKGRTLMRELGPLRRRINDLTFRSLNKDQVKGLHDMLDALIAGARTGLHELESPDQVNRRAPSVEPA
jgi:DNA-binding MarR family transcriptional regulator